MDGNGGFPEYLKVNRNVYIFFNTFPQRSLLAYNVQKYKIRGKIVKIWTFVFVFTWRPFLVVSPWHSAFDIKVGAK